MTPSWKTNLMKYGISTGFALVMVWLYLWLRLDSLADFAALDRVEQYLLICDAFTIPGMLLLMFGCLLWLSNQGALDGVAYVTSYAIKMLIPGRMRKEQERFYDYVERKRGNRVKGYGFLFIVGAVFMAVALIFMALYNSVS